MNCSPPGSSVHGISQAGILEWVTISFSMGSFWPRDQIYIFCIGRKSSTPELPGKPEIQDSHIQNHTAATAAKSLQSCLTLCDPTDGSPPDSSVPGILQARIPEWVAISFSNAWKWKVKVKLLSRVWLLAIPWAVAYQAPLSMGFSRQEYWSGVPFPSPQTTGNSQ